MFNGDVYSKRRGISSGFSGTLPRNTDINKMFGKYVALKLAKTRHNEINKIFVGDDNKQSWPADICNITKIREACESFGMIVGSEEHSTNYSDVSFLNYYPRKYDNRYFGWRSEDNVVSKMANL